MKIRTNATEEQVRECARLSGVGFSRLRSSGSRTHAKTVDVILTGSAGRRSGSTEAAEAATWTEWGDFLGFLFVKDPDAVPSAYKGGMEHFEWATYRVFPQGYTVPQGACRHKWEHVGESATGTYFVRICERCSLMQRWTDDWKRVQG